MARPQPTPQEQPEQPAVVTPLHRQDRPIYNEETGALVIGKKGIRRVDGLRWLLDHHSISEYQYLAGRRLQADWQASKIESGSRMVFVSGGGSAGDLSDSALDAGTRYKNAMAKLPVQLVGLTALFLHPDDHPFSLERCAAIVKINPKAASFGIGIALTILARHYGYS